MTLHDEIAEQPEAAARFLAAQAGPMDAIAASLRERPVPHQRSNCDAALQPVRKCHFIPAMTELPILWKFHIPVFASRRYSRAITAIRPDRTLALDRMSPWLQ